MMPGIIINAHVTDPGSAIDLNAGRSRQTVVGLGTESPFLTAGILSPIHDGGIRFGSFDPSGQGTGGGTGNALVSGYVDVLVNTIE